MYTISPIKQALGPIAFIHMIWSVCSCGCIKILGIVSNISRVTTNIFGPVISLLSFMAIDEIFLRGIVASWDRTLLNPNLCYAKYLPLVPSALWLSTPEGWSSISDIRKNTFHSWFRSWRPRSIKTLSGIPMYGETVNTYTCSSWSSSVLRG